MISSRFIFAVTVALTASILLGANPASSQEATVNGVVLDSRTGLPVRGASLTFSLATPEGGEPVSVQTDLNGVFTARLEANLPFTATLNAEGYGAKKVTNLVLDAETGRNLSVLLDPIRDQESAEGDSAVLLDEITVQAEAVAATEAALLAERRAASQIVDNIGAEEIAKNTGSDAASALKRVTGISLQDSKYVYVRGLGERYSNTTLNGSKIPTVEFDKKVVPLDLFATDLLEKVTVSKSYTADQSGDFAAGVVELATKNFPQATRLSVGVSAGDTSVVSGEPRLQYPGGLGFSGTGGQGLPAAVPDERVRRFNFFTGEGFTTEELEDIGESFIGDWTPATESSSPLDQGFKISFGTTAKRVGVVLSGTWDNDFNRRLETRNFYSSGTGGLRPRDSFTIEYGEESVKQSLMANISLRVGDNGQISLRGLDTGLSNGEGRFQEGFLADAIAEIEDTVLRFQEQDVDTYQLSGDHFFRAIGTNGSLLEWKGAMSEAAVSENRREVLYELVDGDVVLSDLSNSGFLYFNEQQDDLADGRLDWTTLLSGSKSFGSLKAGYAYTNSEREFDGRRFRFSPRFIGGIDLSLPAEEIYVEDNIGRGFELREVTNATDSYSGMGEVSATYALADFSWGKWRLIGGARLEDWQQEVITFSRTSPDSDPESTLVQETDVLPSLSVVYDLGHNMSLRASGSRTVNRPDLRELAPFEFTQVLGGFNIIGNPELKRALITSLDLRWEWFPSAGEVVAASLFYKDFDAPIESVIISAVQDTQTFQNNESATNSGLELEVRKRLGFLADALNSVTTILNYTFVDSEINVDPATTILTNPSRPLAGQPDNVVNAVVEWTPRDSGTSFRLLYNFTDDRIFLGGVRGIPDVFEDSRSTLDLAVRHNFKTGLSLKLSGTNLLNEERSWSQGGLLFRSYEPGRSIGLSAGFTF